jgi:hypothetical protein
VKPMTPIDPIQPTTHIPHHHPVQPPEPAEGFAAALAQQTPEPLIEPTEEPPEPPIALKPRKASNKKRTNHPHQPKHPRPFHAGAHARPNEKSALRDSQKQNHV